MTALDGQPPVRSAYRILIAGGGTGGHLFPAFAIAEALRNRAAGITIRFAGSAYGIEHHLVPERGYHLYRIPVRGLYAVPLRRKLWALAMLPLAFLKCVGVLLSYRPHLIIGVGGYASGPVLATGLLLRRRCVIQEQNAYPGLTNRLLGRYVHTAFTAVEDRDGFFRRAVVTGNPVREAISALRNRPPAERSIPVVLVLGGSQGARAVNGAMIAALPALQAWGGPLRIVHQTGAVHVEEVRAGYQGRRTQNSPLNAEVVPFIEQMAEAYHQARIVVSRAGAGAVAEIVAARRASILIPIPGTSGDHQRRNARRVEEAGAALLLEQDALTGESLARALISLLDDPARLEAMEAATDTLYRGDAAGRIAEACLEMVRERLEGL